MGLYGFGWVTRVELQQLVNWVGVHSGWIRWTKSVFDLWVGWVGLGGCVGHI